MFAHPTWLGFLHDFGVQRFSFGRIFSFRGLSFLKKNLNLETISITKEIWWMFDAKKEWDYILIHLRAKKT